MLYQLLEAARDTHDRGLHLGDVTLSHLFVDDALYLSLLPCIPDSLIEPESQPSQTKDVNNEAAWLNEGAVTPQGAPDVDHPPADSSKNLPGTCSGGRLFDYQHLLSSNDVYNILKQVSYSMLVDENPYCSLLYNYIRLHTTLANFLSSSVKIVIDNTSIRRFTNFYFTSLIFFHLIRNFF